MYTEIDGIKVWGEPIENAVEQMRTCMQTADVGALMADHHKGYAVPIGGVVAYEGRISPSGVGLDIACGNLAVRLDAPECYKQLPEVLEAHAPTIRIVHRLTPIGVAMAGIDEMDPYKD